ncbi:MAG: rod shape-determining protein [Gemmatimonadaceae bacterium]
MIILENVDELVNSKVWFARSSALEPLIRRPGEAKRYVRSVFEPAQKDFGEYWQRRIGAQRNGTFENWCREGHEADMLLAHFKPELSEPNIATYRSRVVETKSTWDPMSQSENTEVRREFYQIASPGPSESDLIVATAAIFRSVGRRVADEYREPISQVVIGIPSISPKTEAESYRLATERRRQALVEADFAGEFGARDIEVTFQPESLAAARGIDLQPHRESQALMIIDAGAGTTDMSLVELNRLGSGLVEVGNETVSGSHRFGGRNLNEAMANCILRGNSGLRDAFKLLDGRARQVTLDAQFEDAKRQFSSGNEFADITFVDVANTLGLTAHDQRNSQLLSQRQHCLLSALTPSLELELDMQSRRSGFGATLNNFITLCAADSGVASRHFSVVFVGGAFRFAPLRTFVEARFRELLGFDPPITFDAEGAYLQTAVALGLGRTAGRRLMK